MAKRSFRLTVNISDATKMLARATFKDRGAARLYRAAPLHRRVSRHLFDALDDTFHLALGVETDYPKVDGLPNAPPPAMPFQYFPNLDTARIEPSRRLDGQSIPLAHFFA